jgi:hypothetical protein
MRRLILATLQTIWGALVVFASWTLGQVKAGTPTPGGLYSYPPNAIMEFSLVFFSVLIIICGYLQRRMRVTYASVQIILGCIIGIISLFFGLRAAILTFGEYSPIYYFVYLLLIPGIAVSLLGVTQFIMSIIYWLKNNQSEKNT